MSSATRKKSSSIPGGSMDSPPGLGSRKTLVIIVTVIGCIAFLWPKVFYPMMFGASPQTVKPLAKDHRGGSSGECSFSILSLFFFPPFSGIDFYFLFIFPRFLL